MARVTGEDPAAGLPDEMVPPEDVDLALFDPSPAALPTDERIERARRAEAAALETPGIVNSQGASWGQGEGSVVLANTLGFLGGYRTSSVSLSVAPQAGSEGQMERDYWYTAGRGLGDLEPPEEVGRTAAAQDAAAPRRAPGPDVRGSRRLRSRGGDGDPGHPLLRDLRLRRLPQRHVPEGPARRGGGLAAPHPRRRRPAGPGPRLAALRRRGAAHAPQRAGRERGAPALALRLVLGAQDRREGDRVRAARRGRGALGRGRQPLLRAGDVVTGRDPRRGAARALRDRPDRLRRERGDRGLLAGGGRPLDRERPAHPPGPRGHDRRQPEGDAARRGRGGERPRVPRQLRLADDPHPPDDGQRELVPRARAGRARTRGISKALESPVEGPGGPTTSSRACGRRRRAP